MEKYRKSIDIFLIICYNIIYQRINADINQMKGVSLVAFGEDTADTLPIRNADAKASFTIAIVEVY